MAGQSFAAPDRVAVWPGGPTPDALSPVIFSPDGAHFAYAGRQQAEYVVIHDGKEVARGPREALALNYGPLTLSPRGRLVHFMEIARSGTGARWRHLFWVADELKGPGQGALTAVYVDGVAAVRADGYFFRAMPGSFTMDENGAVTFFAADGAVVKRYRITASPDMDVDRMIAAAVATQARAVDNEKAAKKRAEEEATAAKAKAAGDAAAARAAQEKRAADALKATTARRCCRSRRCGRSWPGCSAGSADTSSAT